MENATKALIIAASVLIAMLIIALGVGIFSAAQEQVGDFDLSEYEIQQFNSKFTIYNGNNVSGTKVNQMLEVVFNHNLANDESALRVRVGLNGGGNGDGSDSTTGGKWLIMREQFYERLEQPKVSIGKRYSVESKIDPKTKLVYQIDVTEK